MLPNLQKSETMEYGEIDYATLQIDQKELTIVYGRN